MTLKELCEEAHQIAVNNGFWECHQCNGEKGDQSCGVCYGTGKERRNISELLMLTVSELGEACEALRKERLQGSDRTKWEKDTFEDEIADSFIRLADLCQALHIDVEWQIEKKMTYNKTRPKKHGKKF